MNSRKYPHVEFRPSVTITTAKLSFQGIVEKIGMAGMFLIAGERLVIGDPVVIIMQLAGSAPEISLRFNGRVCQVTEIGMEVDFENIEAATYTKLKNIISYNLKTKKHAFIQEHLVAST
jgi:hypothetical protein